VGNTVQGGGDEVAAVSAVGSGVLVVEDMGGRVERACGRAGVLRWVGVREGSEGHRGTQPVG
jgi:hypothetical protein